MDKNKAIYGIIVGFKLLILLTFLSSLIGCGVNEGKIKLTEGYSTLELEQIVGQVLAALPYEAPFSLPNVKIVQKLKVKGAPGAVGVCRSLSSGEPLEILLDQDAWEGYTYLAKVTLVAHEAIHCMYGLDHTYGGLMDPYMHNSVKEVFDYGLEEAIARALDGTYDEIN